MTTQSELDAYTAVIALKEKVGAVLAARHEADAAYTRAADGAAQIRDAAKAKATSTLQTAIGKADSTYEAAVDAAKAGPENAEAALVAAMDEFTTAQTALREEYGGVVALDTGGGGGGRVSV